MLILGKRLSDNQRIWAAGLGEPAEAKTGKYPTAEAPIPGQSGTNYG